ncbi:MAG: hypothetical protein J6A37_03420 [Oscillospiraceae bacterium]|nr:hypothetical protein [Oscillospiraceae bacterium]
MNRSGKVIGISFISIIGILLNLMLLCLDFCIDKADSELSSHLSLIVLLLSGLSIVLSRLIFKGLNKKMQLCGASDMSFVFLTGTIIYILLILFIFPVVLNFKFMYVLLPARELAADYSVFIMQIVSVLTAVICCAADLILYFVRRGRK